MKKYLCCLLAFFLWVPIYAQTYNLEILDAKVDFGLEERQGYVTKFDLPYQLVKKEWWRYVRRFAVITNKKTHYENRILPKRSLAESDIYFLSFIDQDGDKSYIYSALNSVSSNDPNAKKYKQYLKDLILDFKVNFYSSYMQDRINDQERKAEKLSSKLERLEGQNAKLESSKKKKKAKPAQIKRKIKANDKEIDRLTIELFAYQTQMKALKRDLLEIR